MASAKDFLLAFARCLEPDSELGTIEEILERRAVEYRKIGSLFGMEKVQQQFHWNKFLLTFFSDTLAVVAFPLCKGLEYMQTDDAEQGDDDDEPPPPTRATLHDILTQSQWLPAPYNSFDAFQYYLMKLWVPSIFSFVFYFTFSSYMKHISVAEVLSPTIMCAALVPFPVALCGPRWVMMPSTPLDPQCLCSCCGVCACAVAPARSLTLDMPCGCARNAADTSSSGATSRRSRGTSTRGWCCDA